MACEPIHETPPRKMNTACPEAVYVTGGALCVTGLTLDGAELTVELGELETLLSQIKDAIERFSSDNSASLDEIVTSITNAQAGITDVIESCCRERTDAAANQAAAINKRLDDILGALNSCCSSLVQALGGLSVQSQSVVDDLVCGIVGGSSMPLIRREVFATDGTSAVMFVGANDAVVTPDTWTPGPCTAGASVGSSLLCTEDYVCVDTGTDIVEARRVIIRNEFGVPISVRLEDAANPFEVVTGTIADCKCN